MFYYKATIQYAGSNYAGFQWQKGLPTVQGQLNQTLKKFIIGKVTTVAASRTDTGVHAFNQIVKISSENEIDLCSFVNELNKILPKDIRCLSINCSNAEFRPTTHAVSKEYRYLFTNKKIISNNSSQFIANISNPLNLEIMKDCTQSLLGEHDFCNFYSSGSNVKSTIRSISHCELTLINPHEIFANNELFTFPIDVIQCYQLKIEANGFLKQMIRHIVSALWMVGTGKLSTEDFTNLLNSPKSSKSSWKVAPPNGLFLYNINPTRYVD